MKLIVLALTILNPTEFVTDIPTVLWVKTKQIAIVMADIIAAF